MGTWKKATYDARGLLFLFSSIFAFDRRAQLLR